MADVEMWRTALQLIKDHGDEAQGYALGMASDCHNKGDTEEAIRWAETANAIESALKDQPTSIPSGEVH